MSEFNPRRFTEQERMNSLLDRSNDRSIDQQQYFQKMQQNYIVEQNNQRIHDKYYESKNKREQNRIQTLNPGFASAQDFDENQIKKVKSNQQIIINNREQIPQRYRPSNKQMMESKSVMISHKKNNSEFNRQTNQDQNIFNASPPPQRYYNRSLPPIEKGIANSAAKHSPSKSNYNTPSNREIANNLPHNIIHNLNDQRIRQSESQINHIYNQIRDPKYQHQPTNNHTSVASFNQKLYHQSKMEDEEFRKKLITQNERLMLMFEQMQRNHKEEINLIKYREKQTMKLIRQQQEQIAQQNKKIECRDLPPPSFFLAPLQF